MAIAGLILGIFSFFGSIINAANCADMVDSYYLIRSEAEAFIGFAAVLFVTSIMGIVFSAIGIAKGPKGCAIPGLVFSIISTVFAFGFMIMCFAMIAELS